MVNATQTRYLQKIIARIANTDANKEIHIDSSGFGLKIYTEWKHAKYGKMSVHKYIKLHIIRARWSKILACTVTEGEENDSPQLRKLPNQIPKYDGDENVHFLGDAAYVGKENCKAITESGRIPILTLKKRPVPPRIQRMVEYAQVPQSTHEHIMVCCADATTLRMHLSR